MKWAKYSMQIGFDIDYAFEGEIHKSKRNGQVIKVIAMPCPFFALSKQRNLLLPKKENRSFIPFSILFSSFPNKFP
jgi:hypothetical protein